VAADLQRVAGGLAGKGAIDATNAYAGRNDQYPSLAHEIKAIVGGPVAKAFNLNFAAAYDKLGEQSERPSMPWAGDEEARETTEQLIRDAGYEPAPAGGLENARKLEDALGFVFAVRQQQPGPVLYRFWTA